MHIIPYPPTSAEAKTVYRGCVRRQEKGFTIVELMVTVAVAAVLLVIAVPSFRNVTANNRLNTAVNDIVASLGSARTEAIKANAGAQFCSNSASLNTGSTMGVECLNEVGTVVLSTGTGAEVVRSGTTSITGTIQLSGDVQAIRYGGDGVGHAVGSSAPFNGTVADICTSSLTKGNHRKIEMTGGSILATSTYTGDCP
jgi:type IV fimbrial biogenesis protein FimT